MIGSSAASAIGLWSTLVAYLAAYERNTRYFALAVAGDALYLGAVGRWLLPKTDSLEFEPVLRAAGPRRAVRWAVIVVAIALVALDGAAYAGIQSGLPVPLLTPRVQRLLSVHLWPDVGGFELLNFASYALIPGRLLVALGARPWELGLCAPALGTLPATVLCLVPSHELTSVCRAEARWRIGLRSVGRCDEADPRKCAPCSGGADVCPTGACNEARLVRACRCVLSRLAALRYARRRGGADRPSAQLNL